MLTTGKLLYDSLTSRKPYEPYTRATKTGTLVSRKPKKHDAFTCGICGHSFTDSIAFMIRNDIVSDTFGEYSGFADTSKHLACKHCETVYRPYWMQALAVVCWEGGIKIIMDKSEGKSDAIHAEFGDCIATTADFLKYLRGDVRWHKDGVPFFVSLCHYKKQKHHLPFASVNYDSNVFTINHINDTFLFRRADMLPFLEKGKTSKKKPDAGTPPVDYVITKACAKLGRYIKAGG